MEIIKYIVIHLIVSMGFTIKSIDYDQELSINNGSKCNVCRSILRKISKVTE